MESEELEDYQNFSVLFPCCNDHIVAKNGIGQGMEMIITTIKNYDFIISWGDCGNGKGFCSANELFLCIGYEKIKALVAYLQCLLHW